MTIQEYRESKKIQERNTYNVNYVYQGEEYYRNVLTSYAINRFVWDGLPDTVPSQILESMLLNSEYNRAVIVEKSNNIYVQPFSGVGVGIYPTLPPKTIYANPILGSDTLNTNLLKDDSIVLFENYNMYNINETIKRYAKKLAQYDSSLDITTVNTRNTAIPLVSSENDKQSMLALLAKIKQGLYDVLVHKKENQLLDIENFKYLPTVPNTYFKSMTELGQLRNNEKRNFLMEIGVIFPKDKTQAVLSDESENDEVFPMFTLTSALNARKDICKVFARYGYNVSVELNPILRKSYDSFLNNETETETTLKEGEVNA